MNIRQLLDRRHAVCPGCKGEKRVRRGEWIAYDEAQALLAEAADIEETDTKAGKARTRKLRQHVKENLERGYRPDPETGKPRTKMTDDGPLVPCPEFALCPHCQGTGRPFVPPNPLEVRFILERLLDRIEALEQNQASARRITDRLPNPDPAPGA